MTFERYPFKGSSFGSHATIIRLLGEGGGRTLLDVGCGSGAVAMTLQKQGWSVTGIEPDPNDAEAVRHRGIPVLCGTLESAKHSFQTQFDAAVLGDVIEHTEDPLTTVKETSNLVKAGGRLVISVPNVAHLSVRIGLALGHFDYSDRGILDRTHLRFFTRSTFHELLEATGLKLVDERFTPAPIEEVYPVFREGRMMGRLQGAGAALARRMPSVFAYQFVALMQTGDSTV